MRSMCNLIGVGVLIALAGCAGPEVSPEQSAAAARLAAEKRLADASAEYVDLTHSDAPITEKYDRLTALLKEMEAALRDLGVDPEELRDARAAIRQALKQHRPEQYAKLIREEKISRCSEAMAALARQLSGYVEKANGKFPDDLTPFKATLAEPGLAGTPMTWLAKGVDWNDKDYGNVDVSHRTPILVARPADDAAIVVFRDFHVDRVNIVDGRATCKRAVYGDCAAIIAALKKAGIDALPPEDAEKKGN